MEQIMYRKTLDVHKNGVQFMLQGFQTADNLSRVIEISLMASGDAIDFPLEQVEAMMYVTTPNATEPSINKCTIKDNKVVYDVLPIVEEGITTMQLKILTTSPDGARGVLASPEFAVEVSKSSADDGGVIQTTTFTALEDAMAKAKATYDERFLRMELTSDCIFKAYYADGSVYETDLLKKLFYNGNVQLSESYAHGGTGVRAGEDTDNSMYYSNVSRSEALNAKNIMENSEDILENVKLHGMYTAFSVDFESGEVEYVSPSFKFNIDPETGQLDAKGQTYTFNTEVGRVIEEWLASNGIILGDLNKIATEHSAQLKLFGENTTEMQKAIGEMRITIGEHSETFETTANIAIRPYDGTGDSGPSYPNYLDFDVLPKLMFIMDGSHSDGMCGYAMPGFSKYMVINSGVTGTSNYYNTVSVSDNGPYKRVSWYNNSAALPDHKQLNVADVKYTCIAFY